MRIASLLASGTEIVCALGAESELVGISHECDYPERIKSRPVLTESKVHYKNTSEKIHAEVQDLMLSALSLYNVGAETLNACHPDVIITQEQCKVCAVSFDDVKEAIAALTKKDVQIVSLNPTCLTEITADINRIASAIGRDATPLLAEMTRRWDRIKTAVKGKPKPRVLFIEWIDPIFIGANWMPELIEIAGGEAVLGKAGDHSTVITLEECARLNPDVILIAPCGFDLTQTRRDLWRLTSQPLWKKLTAVKNGRVFLADGNALFNRSGPRLIESAELLSECLHEGVELASPTYQSMMVCLDKGLND
jgi:iron complex transport system substrate-binding protein